MAFVVSPRALKCSAVSQKWFTFGFSFRLILPTICIHMCSVARVGSHSDRCNSGHFSDVLVIPMPLAFAIQTPPRLRDASTNQGKKQDACFFWFGVFR